MQPSASGNGSETQDSQVEASRKRAGEATTREEPLFTAEKIISFFRNLAEFSLIGLAATSNVLFTAGSPLLTSLVTSAVLATSLLVEFDKQNVDEKRLKIAALKDSPVDEELNQKMKKWYNSQKIGLLISTVFLIIYGLLTGFDILPRVAIAAVVIATVLFPALAKITSIYLNSVTNEVELKVEAQSQSLRQRLEETTLQLREANNLIDEMHLIQYELEQKITLLQKIAQPKIAVPDVDIDVALDQGLTVEERKRADSDRLQPPGNLGIFKQPDVDTENKEKASLTQNINKQPGINE